MMFIAGIIRSYETTGTCIVQFISNSILHTDLVMTELTDNNIMQEIDTCTA